MTAQETQSDTPLWLPFYPPEFFADTMGMSGLERGAYIMLIANYWNRGGNLPLNEKFLQRAAGVTVAEWKKVGSAALARFIRTESGYRHERLDAELAKSRRIIEQKSVAGLASAEARKKKKLHEQPIENAQSEVNGCSNPVGEPLVRNFNQSQSQSQLPVDVNKSVPNKKTIPEKSIATDPPQTGGEKSGRRSLYEAEFREFWDKYPLKRARGLALKAFTSARGRVSFETIMAGLKNHPWPEDAKFIKYPATWLNSDCWADEPRPIMMSENDRRIAELLAQKAQRDNFPGQTIEGDHFQA